MTAMSEPVKSRPYHSPKRAEQARRTRRRVLDAATRLFLDRGYPATTVAAVGAEARVAADTVLHLFGSKRGLLTAVLDVAVGGDDEDVPVLERPGPQRARAEPDPRRQLELFAAGMTEQLERVRPMDDVLRSAALVDEGLALLRADIQLRQRRQAMATVAGWLRDRTAFRRGRTVEEVGEQIWALTSPELHRLFRVDLGWTADRYREWLADTLIRTVLP